MKSPVFCFIIEYNLFLASIASTLESRTRSLKNIHILRQFLIFYIFVYKTFVSRLSNLLPKNFFVFFLIDKIRSAKKKQLSLVYFHFVDMYTMPRNIPGRKLVLSREAVG